MSSPPLCVVSAPRVTIALLAATLLTGAAAAQSMTRRIDGRFTNAQQPLWGSAGQPLLRHTTIGYTDGHATPAGANRPSPREISNALAAQSGPMPNTANATDFLWQWGQFLDHDLSLTGTAIPGEPFPIPVPLGDPHFDPAWTGAQWIGLDRSLYLIDAAGVRQQINEITAWIDASHVYGSDAQRASALRALDGSGRLKTTPRPTGDLLPFNVQGLPNAPDNSPSFFLAGDVRANEQIGLTCMHTLFVREHNRLAALVGWLFPYSYGDTRYEIARALVGAEIQRITYTEYLPKLLGPNALAPYSGYRPNVRPDIENLFSTASFRYGHSQLAPELLRLDDTGAPIPQGHLPLLLCFFDPTPVLADGIDCVLMGLANQRAQAIDTRIVDDVRNFLFGPPGAGGFDLAALNIQRGRDHGLPDYNRARVDMGLPPVTTWAEISANRHTQRLLRAVYGTVDEIDAWVGGLAEDPAPGAMVGPLVRAVLVDQFERLRDGDRFWYEIAPIPTVFGALMAPSLAEVIRRNTTLGGGLQDDVFSMPRR